mmetsp:Transcript_24710/g.53906  ORF Transcript_24710/g.53906 Transcript_24710/m.53906 type:complete len:226 (-) Transcript_24710:706-1383(-)
MIVLLPPSYVSALLSRSSHYRLLFCAPEAQNLPTRFGLYTLLRRWMFQVFAPGLASKMVKLSDLTHPLAPGTTTITSFLPSRLVGVWAIGRRCGTSGWSFMSKRAHGTGDTDGDGDTRGAPSLWPGMGLSGCDTRRDSSSQMSSGRSFAASGLRCERDTRRACRCSSCAATAFLCASRRFFMVSEVPSLRGRSTPLWKVVMLRFTMSAGAPSSPTARLEGLTSIW